VIAMMSLETNEMSKKDWSQFQGQLHLVAERCLRKRWTLDHVYRELSEHLVARLSAVRLFGRWELVGHS
jgi:hypothetical protein